MNAAGIRALVVAALQGKTSAEDRVYSPRDWPTTEDMYPVILVQTPMDVKDSLGRNAPQFNTVTTVRITGRLQELDGDSDDGAAKAEAALETLREQIERAVINSYDLTRQTQQFYRFAQPLMSMPVERAFSPTADGNRYRILPGAGRFLSHRNPHAGGSTLPSRCLPAPPNLS